jgi:hypothetical protein
MYPEDIGWGGVEWSHVLQDRDKWRVSVKTVNLRVPSNAGNFLAGEGLSAS